MKALILKDFLISLKTIWLVAIFVFVWASVATMLQNSIMGSFIYIYLVFFLSYYAVIILFGYDERVNSDSFVNSLPLKKRDIVISRYLFIQLYSMGICAIIFVYSLFINISPLKGISSGRFFTPLEIALSILVITIFMSLYLPVAYFNVRKVKVFNQIFYLFLIVIPVIAIRVFNTNQLSGLLGWLQHLNKNNTMYGMIIIGLILYVLSMLISIKIYNGKDL